MDLTDKQPKRFYVYALVDPRNSKAFYIGKGCGYRIKHHVAEARRGVSGNEKKISRIQAIWAAGMDVREIRIAENLSECEALRVERYHIVASCEELTNIRNGGGHYREAPVTLEEFVAWARWRLSCVVPYEEWLLAAKRDHLDKEIYWFVVRCLEKIVAPGYRMWARTC